MAQVIVGVFPDRVAAGDAIIALKDAGFDTTQMGFMTRRHQQAEQDADDLDDDLGVDVETGAATGGMLGGALGAIQAATGTFIVPGVGSFIAAGMLATATAGGAAGAIVGGLVGLGVPREEAEYDNRQAQAGATLVTVDAVGHEDEARAILLRHGAEDTWSTTPWNRPVARDNTQAGVTIESPHAETAPPAASPLHRTAPIFPSAISREDATRPESERGGAPARDRGSVVGPGDAIQHGSVTDPFAGELHANRPHAGPITYDAQALSQPTSPAMPVELPSERPLP